MAQQRVVITNCVMSQLMLCPLCSSVFTRYGICFLLHVLVLTPHRTDFLVREHTTRFDCLGSWLFTIIVIMSSMLAGVKTRVRRRVQ